MITKECLRTIEPDQTSTIPGKLRSFKKAFVVIETKAKIQLHRLRLNSHSYICRQKGF